MNRSRFQFGSLACLLILVSVAQGQIPDPSDAPYSLSGLSESQARGIADDVPLDLKNELLVKLLYRARKTSPQSFAGYSEFSRHLNLRELVGATAEHRLWVFNFAGQAVSVKRVALEDADELDNRCFLVSIKTDDGDLNLLTHDVPKAWLNRESINEPCQFRGFFFQLQKDEDRSLPLFVAKRVSWYPDSVDQPRGINESQLILAQHQVDLGLFDQVRAQNTKRMGKTDAECFYQMLAATHQIDSIPDNLIRAGFVELMRNPRQHFGGAVRLTGRVRRCIPIEVDSNDIRNRLGVKQYFHLDMFIALENEKIVIKNGEGDNLVYENRFPVTVCLTKLPANTQPRDLENSVVEIEGFFFRFWRFSNEFTDEGNVQGQVSPLVIGLVPHKFTPSSSTIDSILTAAILIMLLGVGLMIWMYRRKPGERPVITRRGELPEQLDLESMPTDID